MTADTAIDKIYAIYRGEGYIVQKSSMESEMMHDRDSQSSLHAKWIRVNFRNLLVLDHFALAMFLDMMLLRMCFTYMLFDTKTY